MSQQEFARILEEIAAKYLLAGAREGDALEFCRGLRLEELALARACAAGHERAWELFLTRYREKLYDAARSITREDSSARELADSLYAELYGTETRAGRRTCKLNYYTGRGSLEGWLRATLAQEYVNRYRRRQRLVSLEEKTEAGAQFAAADPPPQQVPDPRLVEATDAVLAALAAEDRFILASYYLDGRTLAEIARTLGVHESTISRKLEKVARAVRERIMDELVRRGMSRRQAEEALKTDVRDLSVDVTGRFSQKGGASAFHRKGSD
ncbi:MAG TPA: sigma-70 family RNA polymerase sigma factor [Terriglobales bacterium]|nr:sigma-70 family RNA polymerase sigma factor [Terriglobales bacterium]